MARTQEACLVCGQPLEYFETEREMVCAFCKKTFPSRASCREGHYICDTCHAQQGVAAILDYCQGSTSQNPITMAQEMMDNPLIYMHGPEHHILVGAALLAACRNAGMDLDLDAALNEMRARGGAYPGGSCGFWGACGAAVSAGMALSIATGATPLTGQSWAWANGVTAACLQEIAALGGPRCCKRNTFTALRTAAGFLREHLGVELELPEQTVCRWLAENKECIGGACPYNPANHR